MAGGRSKRSFRTRTVIIGGVLIGVLALIAFYAINSAKGLPFIPRTEFQAQFTDVGDVRVNADLREADYRIGRVNAVEYAGNSVATLVLQIDDNRPVYKDARLQVVSRSGLGQKYVNIQRGNPASGQLENGGTIPVTQTDPNVEILDLADIFDTPTQQAARGALGQLGAGLEGNGDALSQAVDAVPTNLPAFRKVVNALNVNNGRDINSLLVSVRNLTSRFQGREQQLIDLNRQLATTFDAINADGGQAVGNLLKTAPGAFRDVRRALVDVEGPLAATTRAVRDIRPGVRDLAEATPDVRGVLREAPRPLDKVPGVSRVGQPALRELTPAARDLRPLVPELRFGLENGRVPLDCLKRYDIGYALSGLAPFVEQGDADGNWARFFTSPADANLAGPIANPLNSTNVREFGCPKPNFQSNDKQDRKDDKGDDQRRGGDK